MRKIFGTDGVRGEANKYPMTPEIALQLGRAIAYIFRNHGRKSRILIGKDTRLSGYLFETALSSGICSMGADVFLLGPISTPGIAYMIVGMRADAGCVISASHNPFYDNGIKFFGRDGFKLPDELEKDIEELLFSETLAKNLAEREDIGHAYRIDDATGRYIVYLKNIFPKNLSLEGMKIVVDAANGADYKVAPRVFEELGAEVTAINCSPNGTNINDECGALYPAKLSETVLSEKADFGVALDGDGDRAILCDENGNTIDGDMIMAVCARRMNSLGILKKSTLVCTVMSNYGLEVALKKAGINLVRTDVGDRYVVEEMRRGGYNLGGEQSGHILFLDDSTTGDGLVAALKILEIMSAEGKRLSEITSGVIEVFPQILINKKVTKKQQIEDIPLVRKAIRDVEKKLSGNGRVLVRYSGTSPLVRVMVEGDDYKKISAFAEEIVEAFRKENLLIE